MKPNEFGRRLGIGVRVAGRIAKQRLEENPAATPIGQPQPAPLPNIGQMHAQVSSQVGSQIREATREVTKKTPAYARAAGRGAGAFLRPFGRVGGILWLEVTGFFFGLFAVYFAQDIWRTHASYAAGPQHQRFLIAVALTGLFGYLSISAFWRAKRR
jgi:hypothetical protein